MQGETGHHFSTEAAALCHTTSQALPHKPWVMHAMHSHPVTAPHAFTPFNGTPCICACWGMQAGVLPEQLGVITPYEGQRAHVVSLLLRQGPLRQDLYKGVEVSSVDAFQVSEGLTTAWRCVTDCVKTDY